MRYFKHCNFIPACGINAICFHLLQICVCPTVTFRGYNPRHHLFLCVGVKRVNNIWKLSTSFTQESDWKTIDNKRYITEYTYL